MLYNYRFSLFTSDLDDDHFDVQSELVQVAAKWRSIGIALRLKSKILDGIQAENRNDVTACLTLMVTEWLSRNYNVKRFGEPTWQRLVEAVGHMAGGANMALAKEIAWRHKARGQKAEGKLSSMHKTFYHFDRSRSSSLNHHIVFLN